MEKQETEMKRELKMETGNINANKRRTNHLCNILFVVCLVITQAIIMWLALWVVLLYYTSWLPLLVVLLSQTVLQCNLVHIWEGAGYETSCNLNMTVTYFILEQGKHFYSCSLVPRCTSSFDCLQHVKQILPFPNHCLSPTPNTCQCQILELIQTFISCTGHIHTESAGYKTPKIKYCWDDKQWLVNTGASKKVWEWGKTKCGGRESTRIAILWICNRIDADGVQLSVVSFLMLAMYASLSSI